MDMMGKMGNCCGMGMGEGMNTGMGCGMAARILEGKLAEYSLSPDEVVRYWRMALEWQEHLTQILQQVQLGTMLMKLQN